MPLFEPNNQYAGGVFTLGNTAGSTGLVGTQLVLAGVTGMTLSQSTDSNGATVSILPPVASTYGVNEFLLNDWGQSQASAAVNGSVYIQSFNVSLPVSFTRVAIPVSISLANSATANTADLNMSAYGVLYSRNGSTWNPIVGLASTTTYTWASNSGVYSSLTGPRLLTFNLATLLVPGVDYAFGLQLSTTNNSSIGTATTLLGNTISIYFGSVLTAAGGFALMSASTAASTNEYGGMRGMNTVVLTATSQTMQMSQITATGTPSARANMIVLFRN